MLKVAFIDDGINKSLFNIIDLSQCLCVKDNNVCEYNETKCSVCSHGTVCAAIYTLYLKDCNVELISIKVIDGNTLKGRVNDLVVALDWCMNNDVNIVNCSIGTTNYFDFHIFNSFFMQTKNKKMIIVAALSNAGIYTMPACAEGVLGVRSNVLYNNGKYKLRWHSFDDIEFITSGKHELKLKDNNIYYSPASNSFAAPVITALVTNVIHKYGQLSKDEIMLKLQHDATSVIGKQTFLGSPYIWNNSKLNSQNFSYEKYSSVISHYLDNNTKISIPVISIYGCTEDYEIKFINALISRLYDEDVYCIVVTKYTNEIDQKFISCPIGMPIDSFISNITRKFNNDIIVIHGIMYEDSNIVVRVSNSIIMISTMEDKNVFCTKYANKINEAIDIIAKYLIE